VVLICDLILVRTEASARKDCILLLELRKKNLELTITDQRRSWVSVVLMTDSMGVSRDSRKTKEEKTHEFPVVGRNDFVFGREETSVDHTLNRLSEEVLLVDGLLGRLRDFEHEGPVRSGTSRLGVDRGREGRVGSLDSLEGDVFLRAVVRRVVGEDGSAVEGAVVLGAARKRRKLYSENTRPEKTE
jgi:hypothetical protein